MMAFDLGGSPRFHASRQVRVDFFGLAQRRRLEDLDILYQEIDIELILLKSPSKSILVPKIFLFTIFRDILVCELISWLRLI